MRVSLLFCLVIGLCAGRSRRNNNDHGSKSSSRSSKQSSSSAKWDAYVLGPQNYASGAHEAVCHEWKCVDTEYLALDNFGVYDIYERPVVDYWPDSQTVQEGDSVDFECAASDTADHVQGLTDHDLDLDIVFEANPLRDLNSVEYGWLQDVTTSKKRRPSQPTGRVDITETASVYMYKMSVSRADEGWYQCRACVQKDRPSETCDANNARFYLKVLDSNEIGQADEIGQITDRKPQLQPENLVSEKPRSTCQLFGDPHVMTYDGLSYTLPGSSCDYLLAMDADTYSWFIYGRMRHCGLAAPGTCLEGVSLFHGTDKVEIQRGWLLNHDGEKLETRDLIDTIDFHGFQITFMGTTLEVSKLIEETDVGGVKVQSWLKLYWDGMTGLVIQSPTDTGSVGLCGNNDNDISNEFGVWGSSNTDLLIFAESMKIESEMGSCELPMPVVDDVSDLCPDHAALRANCESLFAPLASCSHASTSFVDACVYDSCKGINLQNDLYSFLIIPDIDLVLPPSCQAVEAFATLCALQTWTPDGKLLNYDTTGWEEETGCPSVDLKRDLIPRLGCPQSFQHI